jgi:hypothetical protein
LDGKFRVFLELLGYEWVYQPAPEGGFVAGWSWEQQTFVCQDIRSAHWLIGLFLGWKNHWYLKVISFF